MQQHLQAAVVAVPGLAHSTPTLRQAPVPFGGGAAWRQRRPQRLAAAAALPKDEQLKRAAAYAVDTYVNDGAVVGVGTGTMAGYVIEELGRKLSQGGLSAVRCVPASDVAASEAAFHGVPQATLEQCPQLDVAFDEGDEVDVSDGALPFVTGRTTQPMQPQLPRTRAVAAAAQRFVLLLDDLGRCKGRLGGDLPVVVDAAGWEDAGEALDDTFLGDAEIWRRPSAPAPGIGPRGGDSPYVSAEGHALLDVRFYGVLKLWGQEDAPYRAVADEVEGVEGVVTHGLMLDVAHEAVVATPDGPFVLQRGQKILASGSEEPDAADG